MSHLIDMSKRDGAMAYTGQTPWHGLGEKMPAVGATLAQWREAAGLNWEAREAPVLFQTDEDSEEAEEFSERKVLFRSDTHQPLSVVGENYQPVQPAQIVGFYEDLCERHGFAMETMGSLKDGKVIWALAKTGVGAILRNVDEVNAYLLLYTSYDQSSATTAKFTSVRVVCNNTLSMAQGKNSKNQVSIRHSSVFDAEQAKVELRVGDAWTQHLEHLKAMADTKVNPQQQVSFLMDVYHGLKQGDPDFGSPKAERTMMRMAQIINGAPGARLETAKNTVYGLLQAVTYDVDHSTRARSDEGRLASAWLGAGEARKSKAYQKALELVA